jgi:hypothetical protein
MSGSKELVKELHTGPSSAGYITYGDSSRSKVLGLGKVVISQNVTVEDVMLVETLSYNLLSVALMTHKYRGCIIVFSINKSVEPNEEQKVLTNGFDQGFTVNTSKRVFRGI